MSRCEQLAELLGPWLDGELDEARRRELEEHVDACESCSEEIEQLARLDRAAAGAHTPPPVAEAQWDRVWSGVRRETVDAAGRARPRGWWTAAAAASVLVGAVALSVWFGVGGTAPPRLELRPGTVEYVETLSERYVTALYMGEGEVPVVYVTEVD
jgi:anti-sigma factor RsiW